jgi:hypothetical protein
VTRRYRSDIAEVLNQKRGIIVASLAIGVLIAVASIAWTRFAAQSVDALVAKRLADCKTGAKADPIPITPQEANALWSAEHTGHGHFVPLSDLAECDPDHARTAFTQRSRFGHRERQPSRCVDRGGLLHSIPVVLPAGSAAGNKRSDFRPRQKLK